MPMSMSVVVQRTRVQIWLYENTKMRIEGQILGFDEYMNLVLDEAEEVRTVGTTTRLELILSPLIFCDNVSVQC